MSDRETIFGEVVSKANHYKAVPGKDGTRRIIKDEEIKVYEKSFCLQCRKYRGKHIDSPFMLDIDIYYTNKKHDLDNSLKTVLDCLQYVGAITDDNLLVQLTARKHIVKFNPRIEFSIDKLYPSLF